MPVSCSFSLNGAPTSVLTCNGVGSFVAFSGTGSGVDNPKAVTWVNNGPLPQGVYYIVDRASGGTLTQLEEMFRKEFYGTDRSTWFALYRNDGVIDDYTFIQGVRRGNFRLHPIGPRHLSEGCITLVSQNDFDRLRAALKKTPMVSVPGFSGKVYGTVTVQ